MLRNLSNASFFKRGPNFDAEFEQARILSIHHEKLKNIAERTSHAKELGIEPSMEIFTFYFVGLLWENCVKFCY